MDGSQSYRCALLQWTSFAAAWLLPDGTVHRLVGRAYESHGETHCQSQAVEIFQHTLQADSQGLFCVSLFEFDRKSFVIDVYVSNSHIFRRTPSKSLRAGHGLDLTLSLWTEREKCFVFHIVDLIATFFLRIAVIAAVFCKDIYSGDHRCALWICIAVITACELFSVRWLCCQSYIAVITAVLCESV